MTNPIHANRISCELTAGLDADSLITRVIKVYGIVQGVGFRPTVSRHAATSGIRGTVCNKGPYVEIITQGSLTQCNEFLELLKTKPPKRASILRIDVTELESAQSGLDTEAAAAKSDIIHSQTEHVADSSNYKASADCISTDFTNTSFANTSFANTNFTDADFSYTAHANTNYGDASTSPQTKCSLPVFKDFTIIDSAKTKGAIYISPDIAICDDCKRELFDKADRRYLHPFINCTNCGPRMTILDALPYDRERTSMKMFPMCRICSAEYHSADNRRFDAQPVCCNDCGPSVYILDKSSGLPSETLTGSKAISLVRKTIIDGGIAAIKGIGGFHLCCDATNKSAVELLRQRKHRAAKPFAVMMKDIDTAERECLISDSERELLTGHQKPIVLLEKRNYIADLEVDSADLEGALNTHNACASKCGTERDCIDLEYSAIEQYDNEEESAAYNKIVTNCSNFYKPLVVPLTAPDNPKLGVMLPYAPVQLLIFDYDDGLKMPDCLVMTSANESGAPICRDDADALRELSELADVILSNDRLIRVRADDTVTDFYNDEPYMIRRSRGFAPLPLLISALDDSSHTVLGIGGELKNSFCLGRGQLFYPSPYVGDLGDIRTVDALRETIKRFETLLELKPQAICCDMHPLYQSRALAYELAEELAHEGADALVHKATDVSVPVFEIQHHYAHILSCMAENDFDGELIGVSFDGTGYGTDGSIWGGEILRCSWDGFERLSHIAPFIQVGGDISAREGWRIAAQMIGDICGEPEQVISKLGLCSIEEFKLISKMAKLNINSVKSTSAGRLFDAVSAILGIRRVSSFEGDASTALMYKALEYEEYLSSRSTPDKASYNNHGDSNISNLLQINGGADTNLTDIKLINKSIASDSCADKSDAVPSFLVPSLDGYPYPLLTEDGLLNTSGLVKYIIKEKLGDKCCPDYGTACVANNTDSEVSDRIKDSDIKEHNYCGSSSIKCCGTGSDAENVNQLDTARLAYIFHKMLAEMITAAVFVASKKTGINTAALSGGVFQNTLLLGLSEERLTACGIKVLRHRFIPPNDGGIGLGQAVYAMKRISRE